jgi:hypothetical protein
MILWSVVLEGVMGVRDDRESVIPGLILRTFRLGLDAGDGASDLENSVLEEVGVGVGF